MESARERGRRLANQRKAIEAAANADLTTWVDNPLYKKALTLACRRSDFHLDIRSDGDNWYFTVDTFTDGGDIESTTKFSFAKNGLGGVKEELV